MRWESLFADLEGELAAGAAAELASEVADRTRREAARLRLADRLPTAIGHPVTLGLAGGVPLHGMLAATGPDWLLVVEAQGREALVPLDAVDTATGLGLHAAAPAAGGKVAARLDLRYALRGLARSRAAVTVTLAGGGAVSGTVDRVGADYLDLAEHPPAEPRRAGIVRSVRAVALRAVVLVRSS